MSRHFAHDIFRHFDTIFALDIFDIFVVFRHVVTTLVFFIDIVLIILKIVLLTDDYLFTSLVYLLTDDYLFYLF